MRWLLGCIACLLGHHDWKVTRQFNCGVTTLSLSGGAPPAGDANCRRCGAEWRDFEDHARIHGWKE